jgi:hypothetical protein
MFPGSDQYGDMNLEDVDEFEGLEPDYARPINPLGKFERSEFRTFERDFEEELGVEEWGDEDEEDDPEWSEEYYEEDEDE